MVFFERNFKSSHTQIQTVPIPKDHAANCLEVFMSYAAEAGIDLAEIPERSELKEIVPAGTSVRAISIL